MEQINMKYNLSLAIALITSLASPAASAWILDTSDVVADFYTTPFGTSTDNERLLINNDGAVGGSGGFEFIGFMKFDLLDLPATPVTEAWFSLDKYCRGSFSCTDASNSMDVSVQRITADVESADVATLNASLAAEIARISVAADGIYSWDITSLVNDWITGAESNYGFAITGRFDSLSDPDGDGDLNLYNNYFVSSGPYTDAPHSGFGPRISPSVIPVPAAVWLMGSGLLGLVAVARRKTFNKQM